MIRKLICALTLGLVGSFLLLPLVSFTAMSSMIHDTTFTITTPNANTTEYTGSEETVRLGEVLSQRMASGPMRPMPVELTKITDTRYDGNFTVLETTPSGTAYAVFSGRDVAGNRGTGIDAGDRILLDTTGPALSRLEVTPLDPIRNSNQAPVSVSVKIGLSETLKPGQLPQLSCVLPGNGRTVVIGNLIPDALKSGEAAAFAGSFVLPADAGLSAPETFELSYQGVDDLDNVSTEVQGNNRFQVYQGGLPPLTPPEGLKAKAVAGGAVDLSWNAVADAPAYQLYRRAPGQ
ncbi:MAG: hypothetical protein V2B19_24060, partial [Pseudomonadota bacterium]